LFWVQRAEPVLEALIVSLTFAAKAAMTKLRKAPSGAFFVLAGFVLGSVSFETRCLPRQEF
jgi:hypothetical protein